MWRLYETGRYTLDEVGAIWQVGKTRVSEILAAMGKPTGALRYIRPREEHVARPYRTSTGVIKRAKTGEPPAARVEHMPPPAPPAPSKIIYNGVQVRRFESGGVASMCNRALAEAGYGPVCKSADKARPYAVDGKKYSYDELLVKVDKLRAKQGFPPITDGRKSRSHRTITKWALFP